ncbi:hypothetical protein B0H11DRAFT_1917360 [Mycena galericulata]|nr:hypothetical protein B0H11DRAFT_1917360 [Mycena galericulata]
MKNHGIRNLPVHGEPRDSESAVCYRARNPPGFGAEPQQAVDPAEVYCGNLPKRYPSAEGGRVFYYTVTQEEWKGIQQQQYLTPKKIGGLRYRTVWSGVLENMNDYTGRLTRSSCLSSFMPDASTTPVAQ